MTRIHQHDNLLRGHVKLRSKLYNTDLSIFHTRAVHGMVFRSHPSMTLCIIQKNIAVKKKNWIAPLYKYEIKNDL